MSPIDALNRYLASLERRLRILALSRGAAITAGAALVSTVLLAVVVANWTFFSASNLIWARALLFLAIALVLALGLAAPMLRVNRRKAARRIEQAAPEFEQRLLTFAERNGEAAEDPFLALLAYDTAEIARRTEPERVAPRGHLLAFFASAAAGFGMLLWLILAGPGYLGHGAALLWAGPKNGGEAIYDIVVSPGNRSVRRRSDQLVTAQLVGFDAKEVRLMARFAGSSKWEDAPMQPQPNGSAYEFLFAALPDTVDYYVESRGVRSKTFRLTAVDLPGIKKLKVTYHYPAWSGLKDAVEDPGGDLRAVEGTRAELSIETDRPLKDGMVVLDDNTRIRLNGERTVFTAEVPIQKDGMYHFAAIDHDQTVRLSEDYFIEARKDNPPSVKITRPGRDARVSPIEEVTVAVEGEDDFGLRELAFHYSVNGEPEKTVNLLPKQGVKRADGKTMIALENYKLSPGDVVSFYATARDARSAAKTDMFFLEAQPYERDYSQSQQAGGGAGGGDMDQNDRISQRQKEIIAATWNEVKGQASRNAAEAAENAKFLSEVQGKLRDQAQSLSKRAKSRALAGVNESFQTFVKEMDEAVKEMSAATDKLKSQNWKDAMPPEQKALQHVLRAESTFRDIQVAFGRQGMGGGGGAARDLDNLFDLELDTEKNQYESGQQSMSAEQRQRDIDQAMQRLEQLARRQQQLAEEQKQTQQSFQQRWEQEQLRREAEELRRQMDQLTRGQQSQSPSSSPSGSQGQQSGRSLSRGLPSRSQPQSPSDQRLQQAFDQLSRALDDMRNAASSPEQREAAARRAAERLQDAQNLLRGMRRDQSAGQLDDLARRADQIANEQRDFTQRMRQAFGPGQDPDPRTPSWNRQPGLNWQQVQQLAAEKEKMADELEKLENDAQRAARDLAGSQPAASSKLREALGQLQQDEVQARMKMAGRWMRQGRGAYMLGGEAVTAMSLNRFRDQIREAQQALNNENQPQKGNESAEEKALRQLQRTRQQLERAVGSLDRQQSGNASANKPRSQGQANQAQRGGQQQAQNGQQGGQGGQPGQQGGQSGERQGGEQTGIGQLGGQGGDSAINFGPRNGDYWGRTGLNRGNLPARPGDPPVNRDRSELDHAIRSAIVNLSQLRAEFGRDSEVGRAIADALDRVRQLQGSPYSLSSPELDARLEREILPNLEQLELQFRRKVEEKNGGQVRNPSVDTAPPGYADRVAEYFRRLSKSK